MTATDISLRAMGDDDISAVTAIYAHHVLHGTGSFEIEPPDSAEIRRRHQAVVAAGLPWLVAVREGTVLGYAYAGPYRARPAYRDTVEDSIYVRFDATGMGLGRRLLPALIAACAEDGRRQMIAVIGDSGNAASITLHKRHGFELIGTMRSVGYKHGRWLDVVLLQRPLGEGDGKPPCPA